jgi:phosphatidylglycerol---prolipoprotein diacylglyceryl transferase
MLPVLQIGPFALQTYLLALLLAGWAGLAVSARAARRLGVEGDHVYNAGLGALLGSIVAGRIGHVVAFWPAYRTQPLEILGLNPNAFLLWPAVLGGLIVIAWYLYRHGLAWRTMLDASAPGVMAGIAIASLGALLAGRAAGAPTDLPWAISLWGVSRHPSQLYEALAALAVCGLVLWVLKRQVEPGRAAWVAILGYGLSRWLLEPFRAESVTVLGGLRAAQLLGLAAALIAAWVLGNQGYTAEERRPAATAERDRPA